jgi:hypothetical protein
MQLVPIATKIANFPSAMDKIKTKTPRSEQLSNQINLLVLLHERCIILHVPNDVRGCQH